MKTEDLIQALMQCHPDYHGIIYTTRYVGEFADGYQSHQCTKPVIGDTHEIPENEFANAFVWTWTFNGNVDGDVYLFEYTPNNP